MGGMGFDVRVCGQIQIAVDHFSKCCVLEGKDKNVGLGRMVEKIHNVPISGSLPILK